MRRESFRLLLADDDAGCRASLEEFLGQLGFQIVAAEDGTEAIEIIKTESVDLSVMDIHMPGLTGIEVLKTLRMEGFQLPCIFVSGEASKEIQLKAMSVGAFSLVSKPVNLELLRLSLRQLVGKYFPDADPRFFGLERHGNRRPPPSAGG